LLWEVDRAAARRTTDVGPPRTTGNDENSSTDSVIDSIIIDSDGGSDSAVAVNDGAIVANVVNNGDALPTGIVRAPFALADLTELIETAAELDGLGLSMDECWTFAQCPAPEGSLRAFATVYKDLGVVRLDDIVPPAAIRRAEEEARRTADHSDSSRRGGDRRGDRRAAGIGTMERTFGLVDAYVWLARRFPQSFPDLEPAQDAGDNLALAIHGSIEHRPRRGDSSGTRQNMVSRRVRPGKIRRAMRRRGRP
jgi:hypothetical protein